MAFGLWRKPNFKMTDEIVVAANAAPRVGGQGLNLYHTVTALQSLFPVHVYCNGGSFPGAKTTLIETPRLGTLWGSTPFIRRYADWHTWFVDSHFDREVSRRLNSARLFHGVTQQCRNSLGAAKRNRSFRVLDVITPHVEEYYEQQCRECERFGIRPPNNPSFMKRIAAEYDQADVIRVMSSYALQSFLERGFKPSRLKVIPPPLEVEEFPLADFRGPTFKVIFVGQIAPWKGFHYLIDAFSRAGIPDSELVLWGGPGSRPVSEYLSQQQARNPRIQVRACSVRDAGNQEVFATANVLVLPSLSDGFGYVVAEAMASGLPVIATTRTGASDIIREGQNGYVVEPGDVDALTERLVHLAKHPAVVRELGQCARRTAETLTFHQYRELYKELIAAA